MQFGTSAAAAIALFSTGAGAECPFCPEGLAVDADAAIPVFDGDTCGDIVAAAVAAPNSEYDCEDFLEYEIICCPTAAEVPCPVCPDGLAAAAGDLAPNLCITCGEMVALAPFVEESDELCAAGMVDQIACCPNAVAAATDPCPLCPDGPGAALGAIEVPGNWLTCDFLVDYARTIESNAPECAEVAGADLLCCPDAAGEASEDLVGPLVDEDAPTPAAPTGDPAPANTAGDATPAAPAGDPDVDPVTEPDNGAAAVRWIEAYVPTVAVAMVVLFA